uniref:Uncharacterized protein n=1 Tax=Oryza punctata TaxID=4537 RepID=A0A0E0KT74_ORYPU
MGVQGDSGNEATSATLGRCDVLQELTGCRFPWEKRKDEGSQQRWNLWTCDGGDNGADHRFKSGVDRLEDPWEMELELKLVCTMLV